MPPVYTKLQLRALFDAKQRSIEHSMIITYSEAIRKKVLREAKEGNYICIWESDSPISERLLIEICKKVQTIFVDSKVNTRPMGITVNWS
jgi:hypothetical protein